MSQDKQYRVRIHAHYKKGAATHTATFSGNINCNAQGLHTVGAAVLADMAELEGFPKDPQRLVFSIYQKRGGK